MPSNTAISPAKAARLTRRRKLETVTATKAQKAFAELLQTMRRKPVAITRKGKPAAVVMSARRYRDLMQLFEELEDRMHTAPAVCTT